MPVPDGRSHGGTDWTQFRLRVSTPRGRTTIDNLPEGPNRSFGFDSAPPEACYAPRPGAIILGTTQTGFGLRGCRWSLALGRQRRPPPPSGEGVTDSNREEVRGCGDGLVGRLGVWRQFRHSSTNLNLG